MRILYLTVLKQTQFTAFEAVAGQYGHQIHLVGGEKSYRHNQPIILHDEMNILLNLGRLFSKLHLSERGSFLRRALPRILARARPDIVHAVGASIWGVVAASVPRTHPVIVTCQGSDVFRYPFQDAKVFHQVQSALSRADLVHVLSDATVRHLVDTFGISPSKIAVAHWGIDVQAIDCVVRQTDIAAVRKRWGASEDDRLIFAPRGLRPVFRPIVNLIKAVAPLMRQKRDIKVLFMMHGKDDHLEKEIRDSCRRNAIEDNVVLVKQYLPYEEMIGLFHASDMMVSLAESDETSSVILEAMYCGTVPVASNTVTYPGQFAEGRNLFLVNNTDVAALRDRLQSIMTDLGGTKSRMAAANRKLIRENYDRLHNLERIQALYTRVSG